MSESKREGKSKFSDFPISKIERDDFKNYKLLKRFLEIPDCPKQIYVRGNINILDHVENKFLSVVGSRAVTTYGKDAIETLISPLGGQPICIISGLAIGVDGISHKHALHAGLPVIAVPGSGLGEKVLYPKANKDLALQILTKNGLMISEYEEIHPSMLHVFPARNRLMAALSDAVLLIEASQKSGTMITARIATEYNKDVWCVPGSIFSDTSKGTNALIKNGAATITDYKDILHNFRISTDDEMENKKDISKMDLSTDEKKILKSLNENLVKEKLMEKSGLEFSEFLMGLTLLEMKNLVKIDSGIVRKNF